MSNEYEELLKEHAQREKERRYNSYAVINNTYRILGAMIENPNGHKFFTLPEMGFYEGTHNAVQIHVRMELVEKYVREGWIRELSLAKDKENALTTSLTKNYDRLGKRGKKPRRMGETKYYTVTDEGRRIYKNIKEILDKLAS